MKNFCISKLSTAGDINQFVRKSGNGLQLRGANAIAEITKSPRQPVAFRSEWSIIGPALGELKWIKNGNRYSVQMAVRAVKLNHLQRKDPNRGRTYIITQVHGNPDLDLGEGYRNPPFMIALETFQGDDQFMVRVSAKADAKQVTKLREYDRVSGMSFGPFPVGRVINISAVFDVDYNQRGRVEVTVDGVTRRIGHAIGFNDRVPHYIKMGMYVPSLKNGGRVDSTIFFHSWCISQLTSKAGPVDNAPAPDEIQVKPEESAASVKPVPGTANPRPTMPPRVKKPLRNRPEVENVNPQNDNIVDVVEGIIQQIVALLERLLQSLKK